MGNIIRDLNGQVFCKLEGPTIDYYELLSVSRGASIAEIKAAYHRALLIFHPDKQLPSTASRTVDIATLKNAYTALSSPRIRAQYDAQLRDTLSTTGPRPAQIISLEEFAEEATTGSGSWCYQCRCGGYYRVSEGDLERGQHLIGCDSCSEVVWVGYQLAEGME